MISNAEEFRNLVRLIAASEPNPHRVAEVLLGKLSGHPDALIVALGETAPRWVAAFIKRPHVTPPAEPRDQDDSDYGPTFSGAPTAPPVFTDSEGNKRLSRRQVGLVDWYTAKLDASVKVGGTTGDWKRLRDCTVSDLDWMIDERLSQAAQNVDTARRLERLRDTMREAKAGSVADLDPAVGREILRG